MCSRSFAQLQATFDVYKTKNKKNDIEAVIKKETSGKLERAFLAIIKTVRNRAGYFAELLNEAMKGLGTNNEDLIRLLVCRCEVKLEKKKFSDKSMNNFEPFKD